MRSRRVALVVAVSVALAVTVAVVGIVGALLIADDRAPVELSRAETLKTARSFDLPMLPRIASATWIGGQVHQLTAVYRPMTRSELEDTFSVSAWIRRETGWSRGIGAEPAMMRCCPNFVAGVGNVNMAVRQSGDRYVLTIRAFR